MRVSARRATYARACRNAYKALRAYETRWIDLTYPAGDPRGVKADNEMQPYEIAERDGMRSAVAYNAAIAAGETPDVAKCCADFPLAADNPYSLARVRVALRLHWPIPREALDHARRVLAERAAKVASQALDSLQAATELQL